MPRVKTIQHSMNAGEWSPRLEGRSDLAKYQNALLTCENFIALKYGGASRRPGSRYVALVKDSADSTCLIPFQFSVDQAYVIEAGDLYFRFYTNSARLENPPGTPVAVTTTYLETDVFELNYVQSADVLYLAHRDYPPRKLSRTSATSFAITDIDADGPYEDENTGATTLKVSANTGTGLTMTASTGIFALGHVNSIWRIKGVTTWGRVKVTGYTNPTTVTVTVIDALDYAVPGTDTTTHWQEPSWSGVRGWPGVVSLHEQRLVFGSTYTEPDTFWGSQTADYENFLKGTALANEALDYTLASPQVNQIRGIVPSEALLIQTAGAEWRVKSTGAALAPDDADAKSQTTYGSSNVPPLAVHSAALFLQRNGKQVREMSFDFNSNQYVAPDLSLLAEHITKTFGIAQMAYQQTPDSIVWAVCNDGQLLGMTYERPQDVVAWHRHKLGGSAPGFPGTDGLRGMVRSVAVIPHPDGERDQVWVIVERKINGSFVKYVERLDDRASVITDSILDSFYGLQTDSAVLTGLFVSGSDEVTGLSHLEGETVDVLAVPYGDGIHFGDPAVYPQKVVSGGKITGLDPPVYQAEVGLHYESDLLTLKPEIPTGAGTSQAAKKRYSEVFIRVDNSIGGEINGESISFRDPATPMTSGPPLQTGDYRAKNLGWDREGRIRVQQTQPLPLTVLAIIGTVSTED